MARIDYKEESRKSYGREATGLLNTITSDELKLGGILRIADALEIIAKNYKTLLDDRNYYERRMKEEQAAGARMANTIRVMKGHLTRKKNGK